MVRLISKSRIVAIAPPPKWDPRSVGQYIPSRAAVGRKNVVGAPTLSPAFGDRVGAAAPRPAGQQPEPRNPQSAGRHNRSPVRKSLLRNSLLSLSGGTNSTGCQCRRHAIV